MERLEALINYDSNIVPMEIDRDGGDLSDLRKENAAACSTPKNHINARYKFANQFSWEKRSSGKASEIITKMGYQGKGFGLGKFENGIEEAIERVGHSHFEEKPKDDNEGETRERICILSDSMLNQLDEKRLSKKFDVRIRCHGGCTVRCLYTHLPWAFNLLPNHIIIHVGTNDCARKTSDEVLKELFEIKIYILKVLPSCKVWFSLPLVRTDS